MANGPTVVKPEIASPQDTTAREAGAGNRRCNLNRYFYHMPAWHASH